MKFTTAAAIATRHKAQSIAINTAAKPPVPPRIAG